MAVLLGSVFGSTVFFQKDNLNKIYQTIKSENIIVGIEGLYTAQNLPLIITNQLSYGFTTISENDKATLSPIIKEVDIRENNLSYIFTFKENLYWHNGKKFDTSDLNLKIPRVESKPISQDVINVQVKETFAPLLSKLNKPFFINKTLIGLGPYKTKGITYQDGYIKTLSITSIDGSRKNYIYRFYPNSDYLLNAFKLGEVDEISIGSLDNQLPNWPNIKISQQISTDKYLAVFLNTETISNKQFRQALAYATPKTKDKNSRCYGPISPNSWAYNPEIKEYNFNATRAQELFDKNKIDQLNLVVFDRNLLNVAQEIKSSWEQIFNLRVNIKIENQQKNQKNDFDAILAYGSIPNDPDQYPFWHSTQTKTNITKLNNSRIDKILEEGRQIIDQAERKRIYNDFQRFLLEEMPAIFLNFPTTYTISRLQ